jgi:hypothetical protein
MRSRGKDVLRALRGRLGSTFVRILLLDTQGNFSTLFLKIGLEDQSYSFEIFIHLHLLIVRLIYFVSIELLAVLAV